MLVLVRFSAMPGHIVTAIQSTIGVGLWKYGVACFLTLPKQFSIVYLGYVFNQTGQKYDPSQPADKQTGEPLDKYYSKTSTHVSLIVFAVTSLATIVAAWLVWIRARRLMPAVLEEMEGRRLMQIQEMEEAETLKNLTLTPSALPPSFIAMSNQPSNVALAARPAFEKSVYQSYLASSQASLLGSPYTINEPFSSRSRSSTINTRNRSGTASTYGLARTPSLPDLPSYFSPTLDEPPDGQSHIQSRRQSTFT